MIRCFAMVRNSDGLWSLLLVLYIKVRPYSYVIIHPHFCLIILLFQVWRSVTPREYAPRAHPSTAMAAPLSSQHLLPPPNQRRNQPIFRPPNRPRQCQRPNRRRRHQQQHQLQRHHNHLPRPRRRNQHPSHRVVIVAFNIVKKRRRVAMIYRCTCMIQ